jgi:23S rRNA pseudouridine955/2504/2580 synthase
MSITTLTVPPDEADTRLDRWLKRRFPALTQGALQKMLRTGQVRVDGKRAEANTRLAAGAELRIPPMPTTQAPKAEPRPVPEAFAEELRGRVLHMDRSVMVLDKPHGLAVQGGPGITKHLDGALDALAYDGERPRLVHRPGPRHLRRAGARAHAGGGLAPRPRLSAGATWRRAYWADRHRRAGARAGRIEMALTKEGGPRGERVQPDPKGARAITDYRTLDAAKRRAAMLEMRPLTGRTHQLRVHAAEALRTPILGDGKYGGAEAHLEGLSGSLHLHARALRLPHPDGGTLEVQAAPPPHMEETMRFFDFANPAPRAPRRQPERWT